MNTDGNREGTNCGQCGRIVLPRDDQYRDLDGCKYHLACDNVY
ncbi:MAG: hypothetical protein ABSG57_12140 [Candidatus Bathyarchaeia archaeon]